MCLIVIHVCGVVIMHRLDIYVILFSRNNLVNLWHHVLFQCEYSVC